MAPAVRGYWRFVGRLLRIEARWSFFLFLHCSSFSLLFFFLLCAASFSFLLIAAGLESAPLENPLFLLLSIFGRHPLLGGAGRKGASPSAKCPLQAAAISTAESCDSRPVASSILASQCLVLSSSAVLIWTETFPRRQSHNAILRAAGCPPGRRPY